MNDAASDDILQYYKRELSYLRKQGAAFASRYPKVAAGLALHGTESLDPHTERLIESTAFLAARVHRDLDESFPELAASLLENVCPSLVQPLPSMTIVELTLDHREGKVTAGYRVPRHTSVSAKTVDNDTCRFRTAWELTLWPMQITDCRLPGDGSVWLSLTALDGVDFGELEIDRLRIHLQGDWMETMPLYEWLAGAMAAIDIRDENGQMRRLKPDAWCEVGYDDDQTVLSPPDHSYLPYLLLQEYFAFPRKFHFFDLMLPKGALGRGTQAEVRLLPINPPRHLPVLNAKHFRLGCVPAVNLFSRSSEPVRIDHRHYEYPLIADLQRAATTEIYAIESVIASDPAMDRSVMIKSFAGAGAGNDAQAPSPNDPAAPCDATVRWYARREHCRQPGISGTEMHIGFVDAAQARRPPAQPVVYANLLCTNRRLAEQLPRGAKMTVEAISQNVRVACLYEPSAAHSPPLGSDTLWRLVSLLSLSYRSLLSEGPHDANDAGVKRLQALLTLFATDGERDRQQIQGVRSLKSSGATAHVGTDGWRGYCRGTRLTLEFDETAFVGSSPLMLAAVLSRFFAIYTSINSFVRVAVVKEGEVWRQWDAMSGRQPLL